MKPSAVAILFLTHQSTRSIMDEFRRISGSSMDIATSYILLHTHNKSRYGKKNGVIRFTYGDLSKLGYTSMAASIIPGSAHFPLLYFFLTHPQFKYYWVVEHDVRFSGDWRMFFDAFRESKADLLASHVRAFHEEPQWYWWRHLSHPDTIIPPAQLLHSFHPIYRLSNAALRYLHHCHRDQWCGHFEVLIPTLLHHGGFDIEDFGGSGRFTAPGNRNRFYTEGPAGTLRWRPAFSEIGTEQCKLYHPVKASDCATGGIA